MLHNCTVTPRKVLPPEPFPPCRTSSLEVKVNTGWMQQFCLWTVRWKMRWFIKGQLHFFYVTWWSSDGGGVLQWNQAHPSCGRAVALASAVETAVWEVMVQWSPGGLEGLRMAWPAFPELGQYPAWLCRSPVVSDKLWRGIRESSSRESAWNGRWCGAGASVGTAVLLPSCRCPAEPDRGTAWFWAAAFVCKAQIFLKLYPLYACTAADGKWWWLLHRVTFTNQSHNL